MPFYASFARALRDPEAPVPPGVGGSPGASPGIGSGSRLDGAAVVDQPRRFAVHRNNMVASLIEALAARFPAVVKIVGGEFFDAIARAFVLAHPPRSPLMARYGDAFPDFIDAFAPANEVSYLADVARIEAARTRAYHAADAVPVGADSFAALIPEAMSSICLELHPSVEIVRSPHPIVTIWAMNSGEQALAPIAPWHGETALVARPHLQVAVHRLPPGGAEFLLALGSGCTLGEAAQHALDACQEFNLTDGIAGLIRCGIAARIVSAATTDSASSPGVRQI